MVTIIALNPLARYKKKFWAFPWKIVAHDWIGPDHHHAACVQFYLMWPQAELLRKKNNMKPKVK